MKKLVSVIVFVFLPVMILYGQVFLDSPDYVYGCASDADEEKADNAALICFSKSICVNIVNNVSHTISEENRTVSESFVKETSVNTDLFLNGGWLKKYVTYDNGLFTVYYYLNKKEYIEKCLSEYDKNMKIGDSYIDSDTYHSVNLMIGHYYLAYEIAGEKMFNALYSDAWKLEKKAFDTLVHAYAWNMRHLFTCEGTYIWAGTQYVNGYVPGFEYMNKDGEYVEPIDFVDNRGNHCTAEKAVWARIDTKDTIYRFTFEVETDYGIMKLYIPDGFYDKYMKAWYDEPYGFNK